jgi:hypothetical protein
MLVANCLGDSLLCWLIFNGLFLWRPVYNQKREFFDSLSGHARNALTQVKAKVDAVIPKYKD